MKLIDKQQAFVTLTECYKHRTLIEHLMLSEALDRVSTVEAIPIEWIEKWLERYSYRNYRREIIEFMVTEWKHEQEKQNESD